MSSEDILEMAIRAGFVIDSPIDGRTTESDRNNQLLAFAALVRAATAEDCAEACEDMKKTSYDMTGHDYADHIRSRYGIKTTSSN